MKYFLILLPLLWGCVSMTEPKEEPLPSRFFFQGECYLQTDSYKSPSRETVFYLIKNDTAYTGALVQQDADGSISDVFLDVHATGKPQNRTFTGTVKGASWIVNVSLVEQNSVIRGSYKLGNVERIFVVSE